MLCSHTASAGTDRPSVTLVRDGRIIVTGSEWVDELALSERRARAEHYLGMLRESLAEPEVRHAWE